MKKDLFSFSNFEFKDEADIKAEEAPKPAKSADSAKNVPPEQFETLVTPETKKQAEDIIAKYSNMSRNDLESELLKAIINSRRNGTYNESSIKKNIEAISPFLSAEQKQRMLDVFEAASNAAEDSTP